MTKQEIGNWLRRNAAAISAVCLASGVWIGPTLWLRQGMTASIGAISADLDKVQEGLTDLRVEVTRNTALIEANAKAIERLSAQMDRLLGAQP